MKISKEAILSTLPVVLAEDENMAALADPIAEALAERIPEIDLVRLYARIDELPESLLDILAYDFHVEWWEYDATLEEKRAVMKKVWFVHRHKGTKSSVETAVGALFPGAAVSEWFDYGGTPYHFRMNVPIMEQQVWGSAQDYKTRVFFLVNYFKNLRSVLEEIFFTFETEIEGTLYALSHLGRGLMVTELPEWLPNWPGDIGLYVSAVSPRWGSLTISEDLTPQGLVAHGDPRTHTIRIFSYLPMLGYFPISARGDDEELTLHIEGDGLRAESRGTTLIIEQDHLGIIEKVLSGSVVHFEDGIDKPLSELRIGIQAVQNLNGYDEPWTAGARNLFDAASISDDNHYIKANDGGFGTASTAGVLWRSTDYIPVTPGDVLYFGEDIPVTTSAGTAFYNSSKVYVSGLSDGNLANAGGLATVPANAAYMRHSFRIDSGYNTGWQNELYITLASNAHEWVPYENICPIAGYTGAVIYRSGEDTNTPDEFHVSWQTEAGTVYGGSLDVTTGVLTVDHAYKQFDGTETWTKGTTNGSNYFFCKIGELNSGVNDSGICSHYAAADIRGVTSDIGQRVVNSSGGDFRLCVRPEDYESYTKDTFKSWVAEQAQKGTPLEIMWELAVPQIYQISPIQISALVGVNHIWASTGEILSLTYLTEGFATA